MQCNAMQCNVMYVVGQLDSLFTLCLMLVPFPVPLLVVDIWSVHVGDIDDYKFALTFCQQYYPFS